MDGGGVLYDDKDRRHLAAVIDAILSDDESLDAIVHEQSAAFAVFRRPTSQGRSSVRGRHPLSPRRGNRGSRSTSRPVDGLELEELRLDQAGIFQALPLRSSGRLSRLA